MADRVPKKPRPVVAHTVVTFGDSRLENLFPQSALNATILAVGTTATVTMAKHGLSRIGTEVILSGSPDSTMNGVFPVSAVLSGTQFTVTLDAVPVNPNNGPQTQVGVPTGWTNCGILTWLCLYAKWFPNLVSNQAVGGYNSAQIAASAQKVAALAPALAIFNGGINDPIPWSAADSAANLIQAARTVLAAGSVVMYIADTTISAGYGNLNLAASQKIVERNGIMQAFCETTPNMIYLPAASFTVDANNANGYGQPVMMGDGLHQSPTGGQLIGQGAAQALRNVITPNVCLAHSPIDSKRVNASSRNVIGNPLMLLGSGGKAQANFSGTVPADWQGQATNATGIGSLIPRTLAVHSDQLGNSFRADFTQGIKVNGSQSVPDGQPGSALIASYVTPAGYFGTGDRLRPELEISVSNLANVTNINVQLVVIVGGQQYSTMWCSPGLGPYPQNAFKGPIRVPERYIPAGAITMCELSINVNFGAFLDASPGTATVEIARAAVFKLL
jgi:lysophospholipase L1-like esterase